jgi:hypothetical protein
MTTWADVRRGDAVKLGSRTLVVKKAKRDGKHVHIVIKDHLGTFERDVKAKDAVTIAKAVDLTIKPKKLHDKVGARQRWAEPAESLADETPKPATGSPWTTQADRAEEALATIGARLVAESHDGEKSWYVPPVDVSTVAAHWLVFHGGDPAMLDSMALLAHHNQQHKDYTTFKVPHTHTEVRP